MSLYMCEIMLLCVKPLYCVIHKTTNNILKSFSKYKDRDRKVVANGLIMLMIQNKRS